MKHIKNRKQHVDNEQAEAQKEYCTMDTAWKAKQKLCKTRGMEWQCASCDLLFPSEAFIDDDRRYNKDKGAIKILATKEYCLNKGHWRRCRACLDIRYDNDFSISSSITKQCQRCKYNRPAEYFRESATTCNACLF